MNYYNYFSEIEETFVRRRGRNLLLSPLDWALIESWQERGVPLPIVLRSVEKIFDAVDRQPAKGRRAIKSLMYCREEIEAQYAEWLAGQVGKKGDGKIPDSRFQIPDSENGNAGLPKNELFSDETISAHLENVGEQLNAAREKAKGDLRESLEKVVAHLAKLKQNDDDAAKLEVVLEKLDDFLNESLLKSFEVEEIKINIEKQLAAHRSKMDADAYRRTFDLMLFKNLREKAEIPRLSLFYL